MEPAWSQAERLDIIEVIQYTSQPNIVVTFSGKFYASYVNYS